ncbi:hypothetical protein TI39_contig397g00002 [Zymoseptoria brevis]|uniref:T6SS Phospholipase effector Tle1-like catalytic domain-containing protein n=1 Tax=Zymoseptoria brevis TaxID=1047168 RepID=A0A0F4GN75_9PEZI|nr:hypothetical protein TI39_contig397g00002 [Zymoseptoria brevis]
MDDRRTSTAEQYARHQPRLPKKLIVCCDGTWLNRDNGWQAGSWGSPGKLQNPSNVTRIARAMTAEDSAKHPQIVFYQAGIGTGLGLYDQLLGGGTGMGLSENIREAYAFLGTNYSTEDGLSKPDSIFLLGFSRGAFTARSLGGFIAAIGILTKKAMPFFYECFADWEHAGDDDYTPRFIDAYCAAFPAEAETVKANQPADRLSHIRAERGIDKYMFAYRKHLLSLGLTQEVQIKCIGVWDTVGALGVPVNPFLQRLGLPSFIREYAWYDTRLSDAVESAFQALALDEHRAPYSPAVWELDEGSTTNLKQVWFPGAHSNVGGSFEDYGVANMTLSWMMDQMSGATRHATKSFEPLDWIMFDKEYVQRCLDWTARWYDEQPEGGVYKGWAMGKVYNSNTFPKSLAGAATRTPGTYRETDYATGKYTEEYLRKTNEYIHASVRVRMEQGGREVEPKSKIGVFFRKIWRTVAFQKQLNAYRPQRKGGVFHGAGPLHGWRLEAGDQTQHNQSAEAEESRQACWKFEGKLHLPGRLLEEDAFAENGFEEMYLRHGGKSEGEGKITFLKSPSPAGKSVSRSSGNAKTF